MNLKTLSSEGKIAYLIKPILKVLQEAGGQLERSEIKERIADMDDQIAEYSEIEKKSKKKARPLRSCAVECEPIGTDPATSSLDSAFYRRYTKYRRIAQNKKAKCRNVRKHDEL